MFRKMGNDQSKIKGLQIDKNPVESTDFWVLYSAELPTDNDESGGNKLISVFQGEPTVNGQLWTQQGPLERATKNFMIYRHPSILKFITSWEKSSHTKYLATERCQPLSFQLNQQSNVQICLGLRNILCSLIFLIEQANTRHLNICLSSVYVTPDGNWRLGGFEHLWKSTEVNQNLLEKSQTYRFKKAIDPNEIKSSGSGLEQFAFGVLCEEILKTTDQANEMPNITEFKQYCSSHLKQSNHQMRPKLSAILLHSYFNHEFVVIHSFLTELPLKNHQDKQQFFTSLVDRLRDFDEESVAVQLGDLLLSRMVLLDATAQLCVTPFVLKARTNDIFPALFNSKTFTQHLIPKIMQIFGVRDAQIRLILLEYFPDFMSYFTVDELKDVILPQLLLGIKDTNDILVAATLRCLADLVPILGSAVVVGKNRGRFFADGRPQGPAEAASAHWTLEHRSITPVMNLANPDYLSSNSPTLDHANISESINMSSITTTNNNNNIMMAERLSPDGGEDVKTSSEIMELEDDAWSDWEANADNDQAESTIDENKPRLSLNRQISNEPLVKDIKELDIKIRPQKDESNEIDFFAGMEPVIEKTNIMLIDQEQLVTTSLANNEESTEPPVSPIPSAVVDKSRFEIKSSIEVDDNGQTNGMDVTGGWDDDLANDWGD